MISKSLRLAVLGLVGCGSTLAMAQPPTMEPARYDCVVEPRWRVKIGSPIDGILDEVLVDRGQVVAAGQPIARLRSEVQRAELDLIRAKAADGTAVEAARERVKHFGQRSERAKALHARSVTSGEALEKAETEHQLAVLEVQRSELEQHRAKLDLERAEALLRERTIYSPLSGLVTERTLSPGEYIHREASILTISQIDPLRVEAYLPLAMYRRVRHGMTVIVRPTEPIGGEHRAVVDVVDQVFDAGSGTFGLRMLMPNPGGNIPAGVKCSLEFVLG